MNQKLTARLISLLFLNGILPAQDGKPGVDYDTFRVSRLTCLIGNNAAAPGHRANLNGIFRMTAPGSENSAYAPALTGVNLEHYFDASPRTKEVKVFFEPRHAPMEFRKLSETKAELRQAATPVYQVESRTVFELKEPHYIDITYRGVPHKSDLKGNYLGIFWASYMNGPLDKSIYFLREGSTLDAPQWVQLATQAHGRDSTVRPAGDTRELELPKDPTLLFANMSPFHYSEPFYYGRPGNGDMVLIYIFRPNPYLRFAHSLSGGGRSTSGDDTNPAWDFQMVIPDYEAGKEYGLEMRVVYKPWAGRADVLNEVRNWLK